MGAPIKRAFFYNQPNDGTSAARIAAEHALVIGTKNQETFFASIRTANPAIDPMQYVLAGEIRGEAGKLNNNVAWRDYSTGVWINVDADANGLATTQPDWFLHNNLNQKIRSSAGAGPQYYMDPAHPGWRAFFVSQMQAYRTAYAGWTGGIFLDNINRSLGSAAGGIAKVADAMPGASTEVRYRRSGVYTAYTNDDYTDAVAGFLAHVRAAFPGVPLWANVVEDRGYDGLNKYLPYLDGILIERFATDWDSTDDYLSPSAWAADLALAEQWLAAGKSVMVVGQGRRWEDGSWTATHGNGTTTTDQAPGEYATAGQEWHDNHTGDYGGGFYGTTGTRWSVISDPTGSGRSNILKLTTDDANPDIRAMRWKETRASRDVIAEVDCYLPTSFTFDQGANGYANLFQFKATPTFGNESVSQPVWALYALNSGSGLRFEVGYGWGGDRPAGPFAGSAATGKWYKPGTYTDNSKDAYASQTGAAVSVPVGQWFRIRAELRQSKSFDGYLRIYVNDVLVFSFSNIRTGWDVTGQAGAPSWGVGTTWGVANYHNGTNQASLSIYFDNAEVRPSDTPRELQHFSLASYLLVADAKTYYRYGATYSQVWDYPSYDLTLGNPLGVRRLVSSTKWRRDFQYGYVEVDPTAQTASIITTSTTRRRSIKRTSRIMPMARHVTDFKVFGGTGRPSFTTTDAQSYAAAYHASLAHADQTPGGATNPWATGNRSALLAANPNFLLVGYLLDGSNVDEAPDGPKHGLPESLYLHQTAALDDGQLVQTSEGAHLLRKWHPRVRRWAIDYLLSKKAFSGSTDEWDALLVDTAGWGPLGLIGAVRPWNEMRGGAANEDEGDAISAGGWRYADWTREQREFFAALRSGIAPMPLGANCLGEGQRYFGFRTPSVAADPPAATAEFVDTLDIAWAEVMGHGKTALADAFPDDTAMERDMNAVMSARERNGDSLLAFTWHLWPDHAVTGAASVVVETLTSGLQRTVVRTSSYDFTAPTFSPKPFAADDATRITPPRVWVKSGSAWTPALVIDVLGAASAVVEQAAALPVGTYAAGSWGISASSAQARRWLEFSASTFLIANHGGASFEFRHDNPNVTDAANVFNATDPHFGRHHSRPANYWNYHAHVDALGAPLEHFEDAIDARYAGTAGLYRRVFTNGVVLVNNTDTDWRNAPTVDGVLIDLHNRPHTGGTTTVPARTGLVLRRVAPIQLATGTDPQATVTAAGENAIFQFAAGRHQRRRIVPLNGQVFVGTLDAYGNRLSILDGSTDLTTWTAYDATRWQATFADTVPPTAYACEVGWPECNQPHDLFLDDVPLKQVTMTGSTPPSLAANEWAFDRTNDKVYIGTSPVGRTLKISTTNYAFDSTGAGTDVSIADLLIEKYATRAMSGAVGGSSPRKGWHVRNCEVRHCHGAGLNVGPYWRAVDNDIHHNGQIGVLGGGTGASFAVIEANDIHHNNYAQIKWGFSAGGLKIGSDAVSTIVRRNRIWRNDGNGLWFDVRTNGALVEDNLVWDNQLNGIHMEVSKNYVVRRNRCWRNVLFGTTWHDRGQIRLSNPVGNNLVYDNEVAVPNINVGGKWSNGISVTWMWRDDYPDYQTPYGLTDIYDNRIAWEHTTGTCGVSTNIVAGQTDADSGHTFTAGDQTRAEQVFTTVRFRDNVYGGITSSQSLFRNKAGARTLAQTQGDATPQEAGSTIASLSVTFECDRFVHMRNNSGAPATFALDTDKFYVTDDGYAAVGPTIALGTGERLSLRRVDVKPVLSGFAARDYYDPTPATLDTNPPPFTTGLTVFPKAYLDVAAFRSIVIEGNWSDLQPTEGGALVTTEIAAAIADVRAWNAQAPPSRQLRLLLRLRAGKNSPSWLLAKGSWVHIDSGVGSGGPPLAQVVPTYWTDAFFAAYDDWIGKVADYVEDIPEIAMVNICATGTSYPEPFVRPYGSSTAVVTYDPAASYSWGEIVRYRAGGSGPYTFFRSIANSNLGNTPPSSPTKWTAILTEETAATITSIGRLEWATATAAGLTTGTVVNAAAANPYTPNSDKWAIRQQMLVHREHFAKTRVSLAFNPYTALGSSVTSPSTSDYPFTVTEIDAFCAMFGTDLAVPGNYSLNLERTQRHNVKTAITAPLPGTWSYTNGTSGVGARLTASGNGVFATALAGVVLSVGDEVLLTAQGDTKQNGVYKLIDAGSATTPAIFERSPDFNQGGTAGAGDGEVHRQQRILVTAGTNVGRRYRLDAAGTYRGAFAASTAYAVNDIVLSPNSSSGSLYRCISAYTSTATTPNADATHWRLEQIRIGTDDLITPWSSTLSANIAAMYDVFSTKSRAGFNIHAQTAAVDEMEHETLRVIDRAIGYRVHSVELDSAFYQSHRRNKYGVKLPYRTPADLATYAATMHAMRNTEG